MTKYGTRSPTNSTIITLSPNKCRRKRTVQTQYEWKQWYKFNSSNIDIELLYNLYSAEEKEKNDFMLLEKLPNNIRNMLNELPLYEWPCLLIVFYSFTESCNKVYNNICCDAEECGMYHSRCRKKKYIS